MGVRMTNPYSLIVLLRSLWNEGKCKDVLHLEEAFVYDNKVDVKAVTSPYKPPEWRTVMLPDDEA